MKKRIVISGILAVVVILIAVFVWQWTQQGSENKTETDVSREDAPGWMRHADEPITLEWYINYTWYATEWGGNLVSDTITEETGVDIDFITPTGNEEEKISAYMASDSLPDLITLGWWESQFNELIEKDMVYALNELADEYDPYFWEVSDPDVRNWYTQEDGNIYGYPNSSCTPKDLETTDNLSSNIAFMVRKDIYEAIGSPDMTTPEGFKSAVEKAAKMFPEVDGKPLIPIGAHEFDGSGNVSFDKYLMNMRAVPYEKDGKLYDRYTDPDYLAWLNTMRELGQEGLLSDDIFVDKRTQMDEKLEEGRYFCMLYQHTDMMSQQKAIYAKHPERIYIAVDGPKNSRGDDYRLPTTGINGWTVTLISKKCKNPERAIQFLDYLMSEHGQMMTYLGVEGKTYDMVDGKPVVKPEVLELLNTDRQEYDRIYGADNAYWMLQNNIMQLQWQPEKPEEIAQLEEWTYPYIIYNGQYDSILPSNSKVAYEDTKITELWSITLPKLLLAESKEDFDEIVTGFVKERENLGYDEVMQEKTKLMIEAKQKLGIE